MSKHLHNFYATNINTADVCVCRTDPSVCHAPFQPAEPWRESTPPVINTVWALLITIYISLLSFINLISISHCAKIGNVQDKLRVLELSTLNPAHWAYTRAISVF